MSALRSADPSFRPQDMQDRWQTSAAEGTPPVVAPGAGDLQRTVIRGGSIGFAAALVLVTVGVAANGGGAASIGAGIMVAGFDGFPFGAMLGAMVHFLKHPET
ncbi:MAG: hypothetical protein M3326_08505 [Actinomycetota bacterium]|nr:hypothetical protein [Actinomycetota bacterium]